MAKRPGIRIVFSGDPSSLFSSIAADVQQGGTNEEIGHRISEDIDDVFGYETRSGGQSWATRTLEALDGSIIDAGSVIVVQSVRAGIDRGREMLLAELAERGIEIPADLLGAG